MKVIRHDSRVELSVLIDRACLSIHFFSVMCGVFIDKMKVVVGQATCAGVLRRVNCIIRNALVILRIGGVGKKHECIECNGIRFEFRRCAECCSRNASVRFKR